MPTISIDLATRRYVDIGIAVLSNVKSWIDLELIPPGKLGLAGVPDARVLATQLSALALDRGARLLVLDGPQGWCGRTTGSTIMRRCEHATHTPGKTGLPGCVKPRSWTRMAVFSIAVFDILHTAGWPRLEGDWSGDKRSIESFPTHAWRMLGIDPLPSKRRTAGKIERWIDALREKWHIRWPRMPGHDELQAVVAGLAGVLMERYGIQSCIVEGTPPFVDDGMWREGFIVSPTVAT